MVKRISTKTIMKKHIVNEDPRGGKIIIAIQDILFHFFHGFVKDVPAQIWWTPTSAYKIAPEPSCNSGGWLEHRVTAVLFVIQYKGMSQNSGPPQHPLHDTL